jgi:hypothetical protein
MKEEKELLALKDKINLAKTEKSTIEGRLIELRERMKKELGVDTIEEAEIQLKERQKEAAKLEENITQGLADLRTKYDSK